jgi:dipeptidyl-peptidase 4
MALLTLSGNSMFAETDYKEITLDDIYRKGTFSERTVAGIRSMSDGIHYTTMEAGTTIRKFSYRTGEEVDVIFSTVGAQ